MKIKKIMISTAAVFAAIIFLMATFFPYMINAGELSGREVQNEMAEDNDEISKERVCTAKIESNSISVVTVRGYDTAYTYTSSEFGKLNLHSYSANGNYNMYCVQFGIDYEEGGSYYCDNVLHTDEKSLLAAKIKYYLDSGKYTSSTGGRLLDIYQQRWIVQYYMWENNIFGGNLSGGTWSLNDGGIADGFYADIVSAAGQLTYIKGGTYLYTSSGYQSLAQVYYYAEKIKMKLCKVSAETDMRVANNSAYSLEGSEYDIYNINNEKIGTLITDAEGLSNIIELDEGEYYAAETKAPKGYALKNTKEYFSVSAEGIVTMKSTNARSNGTITVTEETYPDPEHLIISKTDKAGERIRRDDAAFNVTYTYTDKKGEKVSETYVYKTDKEGRCDLADSSLIVSGDPYIASDGTVQFFAGKLTVTEKSAPLGYVKTDSTATFNISVTDGKAQMNLEALSSNDMKFDRKSGEMTIENKSISGGVHLYKTISEYIGEGLQSIVSLEGCTFNIVNAGSTDISIGKKTYGSVTEYLEKTYAAADSGKSCIYPAQEECSREELIKAIGEAAANGIDVVVMSLKTDKDGQAITKADALPYGTYYIYEASANDILKVDEDWVLRLEIREDGMVADGAPYPAQDPIVRGDIRFQKTDGCGSGMANIPFLLVAYDSNGEAVEAHVIVTGYNGYADTGHIYTENADGSVSLSDRDNTYETNGLDKYVIYDRETGEYYINEEGEDLLASGEAARYGIWFTSGSTEDAQVNAPDSSVSGIAGSSAFAPSNERGALPYGKYKLFEIKCRAAFGDDPVSTADYIYVDGGTPIMDDQGNVIARPDSVTELTDALSDLQIDISTEAFDVLTSTDTRLSHSTDLKSDTVLADKVIYENLSPNHEYKWIIDFVKTGDPDCVLASVVVDRYRPVYTENSGSGTAATGEFIITTAGVFESNCCNGDPIVNTSGNIDTTKLSGESISAVVYLYVYETGYDFEEKGNSIVETCNLIMTHNTDHSIEKEKVDCPRPSEPERPHPSVPGTGDKGSLFVWLPISIASCIIMLGMIFIAKRKNNMHE